MNLASFHSNYFKWCIPLRTEITVGAPLTTKSLIDCIDYIYELLPWIQENYPGDVIPAQYPFAAKRFLPFNAYEHSGLIAFRNYFCCKVFRCTHCRTVLILSDERQLDDHRCQESKLDKVV